MAKVLNRIDSSHFTADWVSKIRGDIPSDNKRLRANNLKKVANAIEEYNSEILGIHFNSGFVQPDLTKAAEGNRQDLGRLVQLLIGCAVNCDEKQQYIEGIMSMEASLQELIMQAIQELLAHQVVTEDPSIPVMTQSDIRKMLNDLDASNADRETLKQKCHELENQVNLLQDEKTNMSVEFEQLQAQVMGKGMLKTEEIGNGAGSIQTKQLKRQLEVTQDDLYKMEKERDELTVKIEELEKTIEENTAREAELQKAADQARTLKDEVDILREDAAKVGKYEATIESYKKKLEETSDVKRQLKLLEEKNTALVQTNMDLEEDVKKTGNWKPQIDVYKRQISELHSKLEAENNRADKSEFETKRLLEKAEALSIERDRLQAERDNLKTANNDLQDQVKLGGGGATGSGGLVDDPDSGMLEMIPPSVKERLLRLQHENKKLKASAGTSPSADGDKSKAVLQQMVDDLKEREAKLEATNRKMNQKVLELEHGMLQSAPRIPGSREELELKLAEANKKTASLQDTLAKKDIEMQGMEERYKKYIEKAKSVIKTLDPKQNPNAAPEMSALRNQLGEKDRLIETLEQETEKARAVREMEERLISSAFYNLSMQMHRTAVENRLSNVHASSSQHGQSFLARQRQTIGNSSAPNNTRSGGTTSSGNTSQQQTPSNFIDY